jgi:hypothetical protein
MMVDVFCGGSLASQAADFSMTWVFDVFFVS